MRLIKKEHERRDTKKLQSVGLTKKENEGFENRLNEIRLHPLTEYFRGLEDFLVSPT